MKRFLCLVCAAVLTAAALSGCQAAGAAAPPGAGLPFASFRDVPDITEAEIAAVEALQREGRAFAYGAMPTLEFFTKEDGGYGGYTVLLCQWLSELFGIEFEPRLYQLDDLLEKLDSHTVDFGGSLSGPGGLEGTYMTDPIATRKGVMVRLKGSREISRISLTRLPRYAFLRGMASQRVIAEAFEPGTYEALPVENHLEAYEALKSGDADAYVAQSVTEEFFSAYDDVYIEDFFPLVFTPVHIITANPELEPVISVITKALRGGAEPYLKELYEQGYKEYESNKFFRQLTAEERAYIQNAGPVPIVALYFDYPITFYNEYERKWEGAAFDLLAEVSRLTGLTFELINDEHATPSELHALLRGGEAHIFPDFDYSKERAEHFLWAEQILLTNQYALLSKWDTPNVTTNEISQARVGLAKTSASAEMFYTWFPDAAHTTEYESTDAAFLALDRGEVDLIMTGKNRLLSTSSYSSDSDYKANYLFNYYAESSFGLPKEQTVLRSVLDKALSLIDSGLILEQWMTKTYDYRAKEAEARASAQRPLLFGMLGLFLVVLVLILALFIRSRREGKKLSRLVAEQTSELRDASEAKSQFIANMSHEMRTPMNVVVGLTDLMLEEEQPVKTKENLKKINTAGNTLMGLISDVLDISKIEAGKLELMPSLHDVASCINDIVTLNLIRIEDKPVTFHLDLPENLPSALYGDELRIKQILNNLLSNAFKYTHRGSVTLGMAARREGDGVWAEFTIRDTGIGIREEDLGKLFTNYHQVDTRANRQIEGTGLGLSITKRLVELMDGEISVESEYGKGTTFRVGIRVGYVGDETIGKEIVDNLRGFRYADTRAKAKLTRSDLSYARVLLVDDFPTNLDVAAGMLRKYKMQVDCVDNGQAAVDLIAGGTPVYDAIFMDHMMPEMDGVEATGLIRAIGAKYAQSIPIIALTANAVAGNEQMFLDKGFSAYLAKPINVMVLDAVVQRWVRDKSRE